MDEMAVRKRLEKIVKGYGGQTNDQEFAEALLLILNKLDALKRFIDHVT